MILGVILVTMMLDLSPAFVTASMVSSASSTPVEDHVDNGDTNKLKEVTASSADPVEVKRSLSFDVVDVHMPKRYECLKVTDTSEFDMMACECEWEWPSKPNTYDFTKNDKRYYRRQAVISYQEDYPFYEYCDFLLYDHIRNSFFYSRIARDGTKFIRSKNSYVVKSGRPCFSNRDDTNLCKNPLKQHNPKDRVPLCENGTYDCEKYNNDELRNRELNFLQYHERGRRLLPSSFDLTRLANWLYAIIKNKLRRPSQNDYCQHVDPCGWNVGLYGGGRQCDHIIELQTAARAMANYIVYTYPWARFGNNVLLFETYARARVESEEFRDLIVQFTHTADNLCYIDGSLNKAKRNMNNERTCAKAVKVSNNPKIDENVVRDYHNDNAEQIERFVASTLDVAENLSTMSPQNHNSNNPRPVDNIITVL
jgi:hypothetical protein